jgi:hypothetical protein
MNDVVRGIAEQADPLWAFHRGFAVMSFEGELEGYLYITVERDEPPPGRKWRHPFSRRETAVPATTDSLYIDLLVVFSDSTREEPLYLVADTWNGDREVVVGQNRDLLEQFGSGTFLLKGVRYDLRWVTDPQEKRELYERVMFEPPEEER